LTAPSTTAQQAVIRQALQVSGIEADAVSYVETHGTGTALGDPIEVAALGTVFGERAEPVVLGAVKTNIGHAEAAAGIAGLIKAVLAIGHGQIPANLHLKTPNTHVDWEQLPFEMPSEAVAWTDPNGVLTAGVSAFGFSGTNAHLVLQSPPVADDLGADDLGADDLEADESGDEAMLEGEAFLFVLSARSPAALNQLAARYAQYLATHGATDLGDVCFTASVGRSHFAERIAIVTTSVGELRQVLIGVLAGRSQPNCWQSAEPSTDDGVLPESLEQRALRYVEGEDINWKDLYSIGTYRKLILPTYPFQRQYYGPALQP
ncbi:MAG: ketoacyl-synthetase C-terminal extension domain-containing protein, partial [Cyanobacteria bacterium J06560_2]